jgi:dihydroxyacid dehydratase/phosphogluconate dehydratase
MTDIQPLGLSRGLTDYGDRDFSLYLRRSFASSMGYGREMLDRPIVGICHSASGFNNCHRLIPQLVEAVKRGVLCAGALPIEFPTISLGELFLVPTSLKFRNLMSMDVEEMIRAQPMDAVVLVGGETIGERLAAWNTWVDRSVIHSIDEPLLPDGGLAILFGNLAPGGAVIKRSAADTQLFEQEGRCVVFASLDDLASRIDDPDLDVAPNDFLVLQNAGPRSASAMPEAGYLPIPKKLGRMGVKDMVRISDARMSGTAFGTVVLHVTPDASSGGPLALVQTGDRIRLSVREHRLDLLVAEDELGRRRSALALEKNPADLPPGGTVGCTTHSLLRQTRDAILPSSEKTAASLRILAREEFQRSQKAEERFDKDFE